MAGKKGTVIAVEEMAVGKELILTDWQIACSTPDGNIKLVSVDVTEEEEDDIGYEITAGAWRITPKSGLQPIVFQDSVYYETTTSRELTAVFNSFKDNLHVYDELGITIKRRGVLLGSEPGVGKTALLNRFCKGLVKELNSCILFIDNENVDFEVVQRMFRRDKHEVSFIVLVIEDIGGGNLSERASHVDSTLLNFLDGQEGMFTTPTLIIGTTNYLDLLQKSVNSRPGRFDVVMEVAPPAEAECIDFVERFLKRPLTSEEQKAIAGKKLTAAYLRECAVRHRLLNIPFVESVEQILKQRKLSENGEHSSGGRPSVGFMEDF